MNDFKLSDYLLQNKIGFGSFGQVFKVQNKKDGKIYAAKISGKCFNIDDKDDGDFIKNFKREVSIIAKVHHPSIIKFIGLSMTDFEKCNRPVIVTDFLQNGTLQDILDQCHHGCAPEQWNDTLKLINIYGIASAMAFLHENNIIHRDLKPENILVDQYLFPIIADFGISKDVSTESSTMDIKGTPAFVAPEVWKDLEYTEKSDVYAFAYIVYEIYSNERPFSQFKTVYKLSKYVINGKRPDTTIIQEPYKKLIESCWSNDPYARPSFKIIVNSLKNNKEFINDQVNEDDFEQYIKYIDKNPKIFDTGVEILDYFKFDISKTKTIKKISYKKKMIYPTDEFNLLSKSCQRIVMQAEEDPDKQFEVGKNLIFGEGKFPENIKLGIRYLKKAIKGGSIDAVILYNRLLLNGKKINEDIDQAEINLKKYDHMHNPDIIFLQAMVEKKKGNNTKAIKLLKQSIKRGNKEAKFEYGKMIYQGIGTAKVKEKAMEYFRDIKDEYKDQIKRFIQKHKNQSLSHKSTKKKSKYEKNIDIVFLIDGTKTNAFFIKSIQEIFDSFVQECNSKYPKVYFRFGAVIYYDFIFFKKALHKNIHPIVIDLTDSADDVSLFLNDIEIKGGGPKLANDWAIGYEKLDSMSWNENAEKIVIHACNCPAHGKGYTIPLKLHKKYFIIPRFSINKSFSKNFQMYKDLQDKQRGYLYYTIRKLAASGINFFCLNGNENSIFCFKKVADAYSKNKGPKFIVKNLFGFTSNDDESYISDSDVSSDNDTADIENLNEQILEFATNAIDSCFNNSNSFERRCKLRFRNDYDEFMNENNHNYRSSETTETDNEDFYGQDDETYLDFDFIKKDKKKKKKFLHHIIDDDTDDDNDDTNDDDDTDDDDTDDDDTDDDNTDDDDTDDDNTDDDDNFFISTKKKIHQEEDNDFNKARYKHTKN